LAILVEFSEIEKEILLTLYKNSKTIKQLCLSLDLSYSRFNYYFRKLKSKGLVLGLNSFYDGRQKICFLTEEAEQLLSIMNPDELLKYL